MQMIWRKFWESGDIGTWVAMRCINRQKRRSWKLLHLLQLRRSSHPLLALVHLILTGWDIRHFLLYHHMGQHIMPPYGTCHAPNPRCELGTWLQPHTQQDISYMCVQGLNTVQNLWLPMCARPQQSSKPLTNPS